MAVNQFHAVHYRILAAKLAEERFLAQALADDTPSAADDTEAWADEVVEFLVPIFSADNPRFDPDRFRAAAAGRPVSDRDVIDR